MWGFYDGTRISAAGPGPTVPAFPGYTQIGSSGSAVRQVQQRLHDRGWVITVDGVFGNVTRGVVLQFQNYAHITADGVVGPQTWNALWTTPVT